MPHLRSDCDQCCGLCCVAPGHVIEQGFPADKPAEIPCVHLDTRHRCSIHAERRERGYGNCQGFDCFGAGQWVTQTLFGGADWTDSRETAQRMFAAYRRWLPRFEAAALIEAALPHVRTDARAALGTLITELTSESSTHPLTAGDAISLRREVLTMIRSSLANPEHADAPTTPTSPTRSRQSS